ncbi:MAG: insulinase family protein, partial [Desulfobacterales bacterium]
MNRFRIFRRLCASLALALTLMALLIAPGPLSAGINLNIEEFSLPNGMLFIVVQRPTVGQVACRVAIRAGSALEETGKSGIAHMLEHMLFKGTKNFGTRDWQLDQKLQAQIEAAYQAVRREQEKRQPDQTLIDQKLAEMDDLRRQVQAIYVPQAFSSQLGKNGAVGVNAFTSKDQTQYLMAVPADMIEQWFSMASEQLFEPAWREFYVEKEVIQREWAFRYVNNPNGAAWLDLESTAYHAHPYRNPVIGWKSDMETFSTRDAQAFHDRFYTPANAVAVLVGDISVGRARELAQTYFGRYPGGARAPERVTAEPPQQGARKSVRFLKGARTPLVRLGFHGALMGSDDFYALDVLTMLLSQGQGARLTQHLVNTGLAVNAWAYNPDARYASLMVLGGSPPDPEELAKSGLSEPERRAHYQRACEDLANRLAAEVETLKTERVTPEELERIKVLNELEFLQRIRDNEHLAATLATLEVQTGWRYIEDYLARIAAVTPQEVMDAARRYFREENQTTVFVIPGGTPDTPPAPYQEQRSLSATSAAPLAQPDSWENHSQFPTPAGWKHPLSFERRPQPINYPAAKRFTVNGAEVFFLPDDQVPLVDLTLLVKAGEVDLPAGQTGLSAL